MKFVGPDVDRAAGNAGIAIEILAGDHVGIVPGVDAGRNGFQVKVALGTVDEQGRVANAIGGSWRRGTVVQAAVPIVRIERRGVVIDNGIIELAQAWPPTSRRPPPTRNQLPKKSWFSCCPLVAKLKRLKAGKKILGISRLNARKPLLPSHHELKRNDSFRVTRIGFHGQRLTKTPISQLASDPSVS